MRREGRSGPRPILSRVAVVGTTGSGKTTLAADLAGRLGATHVELDSLQWEPQWTVAAPDLFRRRAATALVSDRWVSDGNYRAVRDIVWARATAVVWLDYRLRVVMWRLFWRTLRRSFTREELWNGNRERFRTQFFSRESLFVWMFKTYWRLRREFPRLLESPEYAHLGVVRLRSPGDARKWLSRVSHGDAIDGRSKEA